MCLNKKEKGDPKGLLLLNWRFRSGFTFLELVMVAVIIAFLAAISYSQIQFLLRQSQLAKERQWVKSIVLAIESYNADTGGYPNSVADLTNSSPPYLTASFASKCGTLFVEGGVRTFHSCNFGGTIKYHYLIQYTQWDLSSGAKIPPKVVEYTELTTKIPWNSATCGMIPPGAVFFCEMLNGKIVMSSCGQQNETYNERY